MVSLNHAVATSMVQGADAGLRIVDRIALDERLKGHYRVHAVRAYRRGTIFWARLRVLLSVQLAHPDVARVDRGRRILAVRASQ
jgi:predicted RNA polymerase sigma factor